MKSDRNYDERQLLYRGKAYQYGFFTALLMMLVAEFAVEVLEIKFETGVILGFCLLIPVAVCVMYMIVKNAYDEINESGGRYSTAFFLLAGLVMMVLTIVRILVGEWNIIRDGMITYTVVFLLAGLCWICIGATFLIKRYLEKRTDTEGME